MIRALLFAMMVMAASAATILTYNRAFPMRDEFDRPIITVGDKAAFDMRTKVLPKATAYISPMVGVRSFGLPFYKK